VAGGEAVVVTHLARSEDGSLTVGGVDGSYTCIRLVRPDGTPRWPRTVATADGPLEVGAALDRAAAAGDADERVTSEGLVRLGRLRSRDFWTLLQEVSRDSLGAVFGTDLARAPKGGAGVPSGPVPATLGLVGCPWPAELTVGEGRLRLEFGDPGLGPMSLPVADLRLLDGGGRPHPGLVRFVAGLLAVGEGAVLAVGLGPPSRIWRARLVRVENIHFRSYFDDHPARGRARPRTAGGPGES
jgi:hypothetical protein